MNIIPGSKNANDKMMGNRTEAIPSLKSRQRSHTPAERDLTVKPKIDSRTARQEALPESDRWNPVPGSTGHPAHTNASVDEDDGGRSANQQLSEAGIAKAEDDRMRQAVKAAKRNA